MVKKEKEEKEDSAEPAGHHSRLGRANNAILIPQLDVVDKELAYRQRLNRPFKAVQNLPLSSTVPDYTKLKNPLSIKDSGTLNNSMFVSRHNWMYNVFRTCWSRRDQYVKAPQEDRKRDKMSKLCEAKIGCGPHVFGIKLFILKDEEREKAHQEEMDRKREARQQRKAEREREKAERAKLRELQKQRIGIPPGLPGFAATPVHRGPGRPRIKKQVDIMEEPRNALMIHNLNAMAQRDTKLATLMQTVASGNASKEQIAQFQKFIVKARELGDPDHFLEERRRKMEEAKVEAAKRAETEGGEEGEDKDKEDDSDEDEENTPVPSTHSATPTTTTPLKPLTKKEKQEEKEAKMREKELRRQQKQEERQQKLEEKERQRQQKRARRQREREEKQRRKEERQRQKRLGSEGPVGPVTVREVNTMTKLEEEMERRDALEGKLTIFQQRYVQGATLVFEFNDNAAQRFFIPKDAIFEVTSPVGTPYVDILMSFVLVHNQADIDLWEEKANYKRRKEEETIKKIEEERQRREKEAEEDDEPQKGAKGKKRKKPKHNWGPRRVTRNSVKEREKELKKELELSYGGDEEEESEPRPTPVFSTVTVTLIGVPAKFAELVVNSGYSLEKSQEEMTEIIKNGKRQEQSNVWYRLDGVKDQLLAETLRFNLNRLDYVNGGGKLKGRAMLKRIVEKTGSEADVKIKRRRKTKT